MSGHIANYEVNKLFIEQPDVTNGIILLVLGLLIIFSLRKSSTTFLDLSQSNQAKGVAILLIIVGHLWVHVSSNKPALIWSGDGISLFLIMSGYGLTRSQLLHPYTIRGFISRRIRRIFYPYWVATILILGLDFLLLERHYKAYDILLTMSGVNIDTMTRHIDYTRWFITFMLFWYIIFFLSANFGSKGMGLIFLLGVSFVLFPLDYYVTGLGWYQIFSFGIGCLIGQYKDKIASVVAKTELIVFVGCGVGLATALIYKTYFAAAFEGSMPYVLVLLLGEGVSVFFSCSLILGVIILGKFGFVSRLLSFIGIISYELFLLHGPFLIKYNVFFQNDRIVISFFLYLAAICALSLVLHRGLAISR